MKKRGPSSASGSSIDSFQQAESSCSELVISVRIVFSFHTIIYRRAIWHLNPCFLSKRMTRNCTAISRREDPLLLNLVPRVKKEKLLIAVALDSSHGADAPVVKVEQPGGSVTDFISGAIVIGCLHGILVPGRPKLCKTLMPTLIARCVSSDGRNYNWPNCGSDYSRQREDLSSILPPAR